MNTQAFSQKDTVHGCYINGFLGEICANKTKCDFLHLFTWTTKSKTYNGQKVHVLFYNTFAVLFFWQLVFIHRVLQIRCIITNKKCTCFYASFLSHSSKILQEKKFVNVILQRHSVIPDQTKT